MLGRTRTAVQLFFGGASVALAVIAAVHTSFTATLSGPLMLSPVGKAIAWLLLVPLGLLPLSLARPKVGLVSLGLLGVLLSMLIALGYGIDIQYLPRLNSSPYSGHSALTPAERRSAALDLILRIWQYYSLAGAAALVAWLVGRAGQTRSPATTLRSDGADRSVSAARPAWLWVVTGAVSCGLSHWAVSNYEVNRLLDASVGYMKWIAGTTIFLVLLFGPQALFLANMPSLAGKWIAFSVLGWIAGNTISVCLFGATGLAWLSVAWQWQLSKTGDPLATILVGLFPQFLLSALVLGVAQELLLASVRTRGGARLGWTLRTVAGMSGFWLIVAGFFLIWSATTPANSVPGFWMSAGVFLVGGALYGLATGPELITILKQERARVLRDEPLP